MIGSKKTILPKKQPWGLEKMKLKTQQHKSNLWATSTVKSVHQMNNCLLVLYTAQKQCSNLQRKIFSLDVTVPSI